MPINMTNAKLEVLNGAGEWQEIKYTDLEVEYQPPVPVVVVPYPIHTEWSVAENGDTVAVTEMTLARWRRLISEIPGIVAYLVGVEITENG